MTDVASLAKERQLLFKDLFRGKVPRRVPVSNPLTLEAAAIYVGVDMAEIFWDMTKAEKVYDKISQDFISDTMLGAGRRFPSFYQILGSKPFVMSSTGQMQHPNVMGMLPEDYDELIASPLDTIVDKILPRLYTELDTEPNYRSMIMAKAMRAWSDEAATLGMLAGKMNAKYGFASIPGSATTGPLDFLSDFFRSFTGMSGDIRRYPEKVVAAAEAITPLLIKKGMLPVPSDFGSTAIPLHMATYMRTKDFEKFYWPTLKKQVEALTDAGINVNLFVEDDWMRYLDYLNELPPQTILRFEFGDPKLAKEKVGKTHIISGFYPVTLLHTGTKEQCIDKAKELLDVLAPGGNYWFNLDKGPFDMYGNIAENIKAVLEYVYENGKYDNYDTSFEPAPKVSKATEVITEVNNSIHSKYFTTWQDYREKHPELAGRPEHVVGPRLQKIEDVWFNFTINLCS